MFQSDDCALIRGSDYKNNVGLAVKKVNQSQVFLELTPISCSTYHGPVNMGKHTYYTKYLTTMQHIV